MSRCAPSPLPLAPVSGAGLAVRHNGQFGLVPGRNRLATGFEGRTCPQKNMPPAPGAPWGQLGAGAGVQENAGFVQIACSQKRCRVVEGQTLAEAARLWNEPRFSQAK